MPDASTVNEPADAQRKAPRAYCPGCGKDKRLTAKGAFFAHDRDGKKMVVNLCPYSGKTPGGLVPKDDAADGVDVLAPHSGGACMAEGRNEPPHAGACDAPEPIGGPDEPPGDPVGEPPAMPEHEAAVKGGGVPSDEGLELLQRRAADDPAGARKACSCGDAAGDDPGCPEHGATPRREEAREPSLLAEAAARPEAGDAGAFQARGTGQVSLTGDAPKASIIDRGRVLREAAFFETASFKLTVPVDELELVQNLGPGSAEARAALWRRVRNKTKAPRCGPEAYAQEGAVLLQDAFDCDIGGLPLKEKG